MFDAKFGVSECDIYKFTVGELTSLQIVQSVSYPVCELTILRLD